MGIEILGLMDNYVKLNLHKTLEKSGNLIFGLVFISVVY